MPDVHLLIYGNVQGVGYRDWLVGEARKRKLTGMVRNRKEGMVEALVCGEQAMIDELAKLCHQGPPAAQVKAIKSSVWTGAVPDPAKGFIAAPTV